MTSLEAISRRRLIGISTVTVLILGIIDYLTGFELSISLFYLIPVAITAWALGNNSGLAFSVFSSIVWLSSDLLSGHVYPNPLFGLWNTFIRFGFFAVVAILLSELRAALEEEQLLANTDPLTGVLNRRSFNEIAEKKMLVSEVNHRPYTMIYIDLDDFKAINDTLGHAEGDFVLKSVADTIRSQIRNADFPARLGGDEFAILLMDLDQGQTRNIVERLQSALIEKMKANEWKITFSIGVLTVLSMPESVDKLVSLTDALMYEVKDNGKNAIQYSVYE